MIAAAAGVATLLAIRPPSLLRPFGGDDTHLRRATWAPAVGETAQLEPAGGGSFPARLVAVSDLAGRMPGNAGAFSLLFEASGSERHPLIGRIVHPRLGSVPLIALPVGMSGATQRYEAVVNTSRGPGGHHG